MKKKKYKKSNARNKEEYNDPLIALLWEPISSLQEKIANGSIKHVKGNRSALADIIKTYEFLKKYKFRYLFDYLDIVSSVAILHGRIIENEPFIPDLEQIKESVMEAVDRLSINRRPFMHAIGDNTDLIYYYHYKFNNMNLETDSFSDLFLIHKMYRQLALNGYIEIKYYISVFQSILFASTVTKDELEAVELSGDDDNIAKYEDLLFYFEAASYILLDLIKFILRFSDDDTTSVLTELYCDQFSDPDRLFYHSDEEIEEYIERDILKIDEGVNKGKNNFEIMPLDYILKRTSFAGTDYEDIKGCGMNTLSPNNCYSEMDMSEYLIRQIDRDRSNLLILSFITRLNSMIIMYTRLDKEKKKVTEQERQCNSLRANLEKEKANTENYKRHSRELRKTNAELETKLHQLSEHRQEELKDKLEQKDKVISELKAELEKIKNEYSTYVYKLDKRDNKIAKLEDEVAELNRTVTELRSNTAEIIPEELYADEADEVKSVELYCDRNLEIAKTTKIGFFVPAFVDIAPLKKLFPSSKFIIMNEDTNFDVGSSVTGAIVCTKGAKHSTYREVINQCNKYRLKYRLVSTYGINTMFNAAMILIDN